MAITISPELEGRIQRVVSSGRYATTEQAMEAAVRQLEADGPLAAWSKEELDAAIAEGIWSAENEPLMTPEEALASLNQLRSELNRG